jgi:CRISPR-associated protein Csm4
MQRQFTVIRLEIEHSIHLGSFREDYETSESLLHSDSLYSAIIQAWRNIGVQHPLVSEEQLEIAPDPRFTISSLFPFFKSEKSAEPIYFFPVPISGWALRDESLRDKIKHVQWLDLTQFRHLLETGFLKNEDADFVKRKFYTARPDFEPDFMQAVLHPRVYVPRVGETNDSGKTVSDTVIFYLERLFFREGSGLFCLSTFDDAQIKADVKVALEYLQDEGLGTDRHVGHGQFTLQEMENFGGFDGLPDSDFSLNLSLFCPENQPQLSAMLDPDHSRYALLKRGGWLTTEPDLSVRKDSVYMFREGGIFKTNVETAGKSHDLRPAVLGSGHPVWRVGKSLFLPIYQK